MPIESPFTFEHGLEWCEGVLKEPPEESSTGLLLAVKDDAVFGNKPQENFGSEGDAGKVTIRAIEPSVMVLPEKYLSEVGTDCDPMHLSQFLIPMRRRKFWSSIDPGLKELKSIPIVLGRGSRNQAVISYPVHVIKSNIPYDAIRGGFDLRSQSVTVGKSSGEQFN